MLMPVPVTVATFIHEFDTIFRHFLVVRYDFFLQSPVLAGQMRHDTEFDWGGTRIFVSTAIVEGLRCFFIEPKNGFFATPTVYGRYDDEVRGGRDGTCLFAFAFVLFNHRMLAVQPPYARGNKRLQCAVRVGDAAGGGVGTCH
jgi:hypothetical protein